MAEKTERKLLAQENPVPKDRGPDVKTFFGKLVLGALDVGDAVFQAGVNYERRRIIEWLKNFGTDAQHMVEVLEKGEHVKKEG